MLDYWNVMLKTSTTMGKLPASILRISSAYFRLKKSDCLDVNNILLAFINYIFGKVFNVATFSYKALQRRTGCKFSSYML